MQLVTGNLAIDRRQHHPVPLNQALAFEGIADNYGLKVPSVAGHFDLGTGQSRLDQRLDLFCFHLVSL